tara:strand:- start:445 stop:642 length:198 start_codon:yes stop_codon:yes gene_type:complete
MSRIERVAFAGQFQKRGNFNYCQWIENSKFCHKPSVKKNPIPYCKKHYDLSLNPNNTYWRAKYQK